MRVGRGAVAALVAGTALALGACGGTDEIAEEAVERATGGEVKLERDGANTEIEVGGETYSNTQGGLAEGFPEDVPLPRGFEVSTSTKTGADGFQAFGRIEDAGAAFRALRDELRKGEWNLDVARQSAGSLAGTFQIVASKGGRRAIYNSAKANEGANLTVVVEG